MDVPVARDLAGDLTWPHGGMMDDRVRALRTANIYEPLANSVVSNRTSIPGVCLPSVNACTRLKR